jgi:hypothetical protein
VRRSAATTPNTAHIAMRPLLSSLLSTSSVHWQSRLDHQSCLHPSSHPVAKWQGHDAREDEERNEAVGTMSRCHGRETNWHIIEDWGVDVVQGNSAELRHHCHHTMQWIRLPCS